MRFIIEPNRINQFAELKEFYQTEKKINLDEKPSSFGLPTFLGGTDIPKRSKQIQFLQKIHHLFQQFLTVGETTNKLEPNEQLLAFIMSTRIIIAACLYVQSKNTKTSTINRIINKILNISDTNYFDDEDENIYFETAARFVNTHPDPSKINENIHDSKLRFLNQEWENFRQFVLSKVKKQQPDEITHYPVTDIIQPLFKTTFTYVGFSLGLLSAEILNRSSLAISPKIKLTSAIGSFALMFTGSTTGVTILAPTVAAMLWSSFSSVFIAGTTGKAMGCIGKGAGVAVGVPIDLTFKLLKYLCAAIYKNLHPEPAEPKINGLRLADGACMILGQPLALKFYNEQEQNPKLQVLEIDEHGISVDKKKVSNEIIPELQEVMQQLTKTLQTKPEPVEVHKDNRASVAI